MQKLKKHIYTLAVCSLALLTSCTTTSPLMRGGRAPGDTHSLNGLQGMHTRHVSGHKTKGLNFIRTKALQEIGISLGAQSALASRAKHINGDLFNRGRKLDLIFNFQGLMLKDNIMPPVLVEGDTTLHKHSSNTLRLADKTYKIIRQAHFVTTAPNWRDYLWLDYSEPERPDSVMLPRDAQEQAVWDEAVENGWNSGIEQANTIFRNNLARLRRDYKGMVRYRKLLAQHMVSPPYVAHTKLGVTGDSNNLRINDQVLRIAALPHMNMNSESWEAAVTKTPEKFESERTFTHQG